MGLDFGFESGEVFFTKLADSQRPVFTSHLIKDHWPRDHRLERTTAQLLRICVKRIGNSILIIWQRTKASNVRSVSNVMAVDHFLGRTLRTVDNVVLTVPTKQFSIAINKVPFVAAALEPLLSL